MKHVILYVMVAMLLLSSLCAWYTQATVCCVVTCVLATVLLGVWFYHTVLNFKVYNTLRSNMDEVDEY